MSVPCGAGGGAGPGGGAATWGSGGAAAIPRGASIPGEVKLVPNTPLNSSHLPCLTAGLFNMFQKEKQ